MIPVRIGFLPLLDAAPLLVARDLGFGAAQGLKLELCADVSWANLRDKLSIGHYDAAHMLAPAALGIGLGLSQPHLALHVPFVLSFNGNALALSSKLAAALAGIAPDARRDWRQAAKALGVLCRERKQTLTFATVFAFSNHTYLLHEFLRQGGLDPLQDVRVLVLPPSAMVNALAEGSIDGFCAGSPWPSLAVENGGGVIAALGSEIWPRCAEKVLVLPVHSSLEGRGITQRLVACLQQAADWLADRANTERAAQILAQDESCGWPAALCAALLRGEVKCDASGQVRHDAGFIGFGGGRHNLPERAQARWIVDQMRLAGQSEASEAMMARAEGVFAPVAPHSD